MVSTRYLKWLFLLFNAKAETLQWMHTWTYRNSLLLLSKLLSLIGISTFYAAHLKMHKGTIRVEAKDVKLIPSMAVTAEVKTTQRRVIEYFLSPLLRYKQESIRER